MTLTLEPGTRGDSIRTDFENAVARLRDARSDQCRKDTPAARARVRACLAQVDALLDRWNDSAPILR